MPSFTDFLLFLLAWFLLGIAVGALLSIFKWQFGKSYSTTIVHNHYDSEFILAYLIYDLEQTERIFSVDSSGETVCTWNQKVISEMFPQITVDDNEDHDLFRNNAGRNQL